MNILVFNWRDIKNTWAGGSEIYIHEIIRTWVKLGHDVTLFCGEDIEKKLPREENIDGVRIIRKGGRFSLYIWAFIYYFKFLRKNKDFIIDVENGIPFFTPLYCRKKKLCLVYHVHGKQFFYEFKFPLNIVGYILERLLFPLIYKKTPIISISKSTKEELIKIGLSKSKIRIVNPGINEIKENNLGKYSKPTMLYLGRIKRYKRISTLVDIFPDVLERVPNARLIIAGWGTDAPSVSDIVMKGGFRRNIRILGPVSAEEKRNLLSKSWVFVNPSIHEGWGISVIEANLYGTPAISFNVPGLSDAIKNNITGFLCKDKEDLTSKIIEVLQNKDLRKRLGASSKEWASKFNWEKASKDSIKIIEEVKIGVI